MNKEKTGELIKAARTRKGYTQQELGDLLGVTNKAVSRWENGESFPDVAVLETLAHTLDLKIQDLVIGEIQPEENAQAELSMTEMVRLVRIQARQHRNRIALCAMVLFALVFAAWGGLCEILGHVYFSSYYSWVFYAIFSFLLAMTLYEGCSRDCFGPISLIGEKCALVMSGFTYLFSIVATWLVMIFWIYDFLPFGLKIENLGPFLNRVYLGTFLFHLALILYEVYRKLRGKDLTHLLTLMAIGNLYIVVVLRHYLACMTSADGVFPVLAVRTTIVTTELLVAMAIAVIAIHHQKNP